MAGGSWASFLEWRYFVRAAESGLGSPDTNPAALDEGPRLVQRPDPFGRQRHDHPPMIPDPALRVHFSLDETGCRPRAARGPMIRANRNRPEKNFAISPEFCAGIGAGIVLAGIILTQSVRIESRIGRLEQGLPTFANEWRSSKACWKGCARPSPAVARPHPPVRTDRA